MAAGSALGIAGFPSIVRAAGTKKFVKPIVIRSSAKKEDEPTWGWTQDIPRILREKYDVEVEFKVFKSFEFLSQSASMAGVQTGVLDVLQTDKAPWSVYTDAFKFADLGYSLPDWDTSLRFMKSDLFKKRAAIMEQQVPVKVLPPFGGGGFRMLYNRVRQLQVPADTKGLKYRTTGSAQEIAVVKSWGASPTPMPWYETYTALQQGVIDGVHVPPV